jgi:NAD(P)-dependent dehydrogenase (short-subunit alcohol dehydrogenase family)
MVMAGILEGKVAVITGASSGIGAGTARVFAKEGARLVIAARRVDKLQALAEELGTDVLVHQTDVTKEDQVLSLFAAAEAFGPIDVLINNAGIAVHQPTLEVTYDDWQRVIDINLTSAFLCAREAFRVMTQRRRGKIITIGSLSAQMPRVDTIAYAATKFGLEGMTRSLALDGRPYGVTASIIHPGSTQSELAGQKEDRTRDPAKAMAAEEIGRAIALMAALPETTNFLTATMLPIDQPYLGRG